ncbi:IS3 family transposase [Pontibacter pamirensis]|uniref:IS3 family transposase n=1 Tax=Pontibacter pamirensis TaxID=2562824 RepID=UPI0021D13B82|nr:IS3 family transposase [Pontibacter pamirensis]
MAESFFKKMKTEMVYHHKFATIAEAKLAVFEYIESFYNRKRRHSALGYLTPCQYEESLYQQSVAA